MFLHAVGVSPNHLIHNHTIQEANAVMDILPSECSCRAAFPLPSRLVKHLAVHDTNSVFADLVAIMTADTAEKLASGAKQVATRVKDVVQIVDENVIQSIEPHVKLLGPVLKQLRQTAQDIQFSVELCVDIVRTVTYRGPILCDLLTLGNLYPEENGELNSVLDDLLAETMRCLEIALFSVQKHMQMKIFTLDRYLKSGKNKKDIEKQKETLEKRFADIQVLNASSDSRNADILAMQLHPSFSL